MDFFERVGIKIAARRVEQKLGLTEGKVETKEWYKSKSIWAAVVTGVLGVIQAYGQVTGQPIEIPEYVYAFLGALGLYGLRTGDKSIK